MKMSESDTFVCQGVQMRRVNQRITATAEVPIALVVCHNEEDVGLPGRGCILATQEKKTTNSYAYNEAFPHTMAIGSYEKVANSGCNSNQGIFPL